MAGLVEDRPGVGRRCVLVRREHPLPAAHLRSPARLDVVGQVAVDRGHRLGGRLLAAADRTAGSRAALAAVGLAALLVTVLKATFDRARPPLANPALDVVGSLPASASFPSGHAATAFAAAVAVGMIHPRLRRPLLALAVLVAVSRVYLGVHYATDVIVGSAIGALLGFAAGWTVRAAAPAPTAPSPSRAPA